MGAAAVECYITAGLGVDGLGFHYLRQVKAHSILHGFGDGFQGTDGGRVMASTPLPLSPPPMTVTLPILLIGSAMAWAKAGRISITI